MANTTSPSNKKLRILVLTHPDLIPPVRPKSTEIENAPWKTEHDVLTGLRALGHDAHPVGLNDELHVVKEAQAEHSPHLAFNLMEEFDGISSYDQNVVSYLELLALPYTGCNPRGLMLARDKALAKKLLTYHGVPTPRFEVFRRGHAIRRPKELEFPLIVKSLTEEASLGISRSSIVHDDEKLNERILFLHDSLATDALVESYVDGRELYVGVLGNRRLDLLPVWELVLPKASPGSPRIATRRVKWNEAYRKRHGICHGHLLWHGYSHFHIHAWRLNLWNNSTRCSVWIYDAKEPVQRYGVHCLPLRNDERAYIPA